MTTRPTDLFAEGTDPSTLASDEVISSVWNRLAAAADDPEDPMHLQVLATKRLDGSPDARLMVLRGVSIERGVLWYHADSGSEKIRQIDSDARVAVVVYDPATDLQLRLHGICQSIHSEEELRAHWQHMRSIVQQLRHDAIEPPPHDLRLDALNRSDHDLWWQPDHFAVLEFVPLTFDVHVPHAGHPYRRTVQLPKPQVTPPQTP